MKVLLFLPLTLLGSVALFGLQKLRRKEHDQVFKRNRFQDIKLRVAADVLTEYQSEHAESKLHLERTRTDLQIEEDKGNQAQTKADNTKAELDLCKGGQKTLADELASLEAQFNTLKAESEKEKSSWGGEEQTLQQQLKTRSSVCNFLKPDAVEARKLCFEGAVEEHKAEAPKQEEPKAEAPKKEEPKAEAPKKEEPKAEAPKQEEPKAEAPKKEEPKAEAPKQEEPKAEGPKKEEPKAEAPKQEEPKQEAPKKEEPKAEAPKQEEPKQEAPKKEEPKEEAPKKEEPKQEAPKKEEPKAEAPKKR